jgi:hypothetical protein
LNSALWVRRTRRAAVAFFLSFIVKTPMRRARTRQVYIAWVSTYPTVQILQTTSVASHSGTGADLMDASVPLGFLCGQRTDPVKIALGETH